MTSNLEKLEKLWSLATTPEKANVRMQAVYDLESALRRSTPILIEILRAAKSGPCRHFGDHRGGYCDLCIALKKFDEAVL